MRVGLGTLGASFIDFALHSAVGLVDVLQSPHHALLGSGMICGVTGNEPLCSPAFEGPRLACGAQGQASARVAAARALDSSNFRRGDLIRHHGGRRQQLQARPGDVRIRVAVHEEFRNGWGVLELIRLPCFRNVALQAAEFVPDIAGIVDIQGGDALSCRAREV
jgi:hypothetical protein